MKNKILLFVVTIVVVAIGTSIFILGVFEQTTEVDNRFLSGTIQEKAYEPSVTKFAKSTYMDSENNNNFYVFGMADSLKFFSELYEMMGAKKIAPQTYNGIKWDIYVITPPVYKKMYNPSYEEYGYLCVASGKTGDYFIEVTSLTLEADEELQSELFTKYTKPLLESIEFKDPENPPKEHQQLIFGEEEFDYVLQYIYEYGVESFIKDSYNLE